MLMSRIVLFCTLSPFCLSATTVESIFSTRPDLSKASLQTSVIRNNEVLTRFFIPLRYGDFVVEHQEKETSLFICSSDCIDNVGCEARENIFTVNVPLNYTILSSEGLDDDLMPLANQQWKKEGNSYTLRSLESKGICLHLKIAEGKSSGEKKVTKQVQEKIEDRVKHYENNDLFVVGDVVLIPDGASKIRKIVHSLKPSDKILIDIFQDSVAPKRLAHLYPSAEIFSKKRAEVLKHEFLRQGIRSENIETRVFFKSTEATKIILRVIE